MNDSLNKVLIIGLGSIGSRHLRLIKEFFPEKYCVLLRSGLGKENPEESLADEVIYSPDEVKDEFSSVIISTPSTFHLDNISFLLSKKNLKNILVEKPISDNFSKVNDLLYDIEKSNIKILVGYVLRYLPEVKKIKQVLDEELLGKILHVQVDAGSYLPSWRPNQNYRRSVSANKNLGGGILLELSHEIDYLKYFFGNFDHIFANTSNTGTLDIDVSDLAHLFIKTKSGVICNATLDFCRLHTTRKCKIFGSEASLSWDISKHSVEINYPGNKEFFDFGQSHNQMYIDQLEHFFSLDQDKTYPIVSFADGLETLRVISSAERSSKYKKIIYL